MCGLRAVTSIGELATYLSICAKFGVRPGRWALSSTQCSRNDLQVSVSKRTECSRLWMMTGLKTFNSKLPCDAPSDTATSLAMTCTLTIVIASDCVGFTLPGMIDEPGSFSGIVISASPHFGPDAIQRTSLAIFIRAQASVL